MVNVKNIVELPLAESAEGLNLIVNDDGAAKQIAASAVGAQADWAETDENSPAFVKNKPGVAQPDWNETDESKAAFIKNKPFYDTREFDTIEVTFDGNIENKENVNLGEDSYLVKVSDKTPTKEEVIGSTMSINGFGEVFSVELHEDDLQVVGDLLMGSEGTFLIAYTDCSLMGLSFTKGIWFGKMSSDSYMSSLSWYGAVSGELKQINSKCIKDMYYTEKIVNAEVLAEITKTPELSDMTIYIEEPMVALVDSGIYTVTWNGVEYQCMCMTESGSKILLPAVDDFVIIQNPEMKNEGFNAIVEVYDGSESVTMSIVGTYDKIHKIDQKYIPNEGDGAQAIGENAHAEGSGTLASGFASHAEGGTTAAEGSCSHAEGWSTKASGDHSHAEGYYTKASGNNSHVQGKYNIEDLTNKYAHIVGNGTSNARSNAHTLDWSGNAWYAGAVECDGIILTAPNGIKYQITITDDGTLSAHAISIPMPT